MRDSGDRAGLRTLSLQSDWARGRSGRSRLLLRALRANGHFCRRQRSRRLNSVLYSRPAYNRARFAFKSCCWSVSVSMLPRAFTSHFAGFKSRGIPSHTRPSNTRPLTSFLAPPHCLKKKGTLAFSQRSRISQTHSSFIGRHPGPDSPPTMTHDIPLSGKSGIADSKGSRERNLTYASVERSSSMRE